MNKPLIVKVVNSIYWTLLSAWFGCMAMTGIVAMIAFPTLRDLNPTLPGFAGYAGEHWSIAAGHVMRKVFLVNDAVQLVALVGCSLIMGLQVTVMGQRRERGANALRGICLFALMCSTAYYLLALSTRMDANLQEYWTRAAAGADGAGFKAAFDKDHVVAENILKFNLFMLLGLILSSACALTTNDADAAPEGRTPITRSSALQEPALLRGGAR